MVHSDLVPFLQRLSVRYSVGRQKNMPNESSVRSKDAKERDDALLGQGSLASLYDSILTSIVRIQASRQQIQDAESFRRRIKSTLQEIEQISVSAGYDGRDIRDAH